ncbi:MAG: type II methionyl aminopeptidase [Rhabdochlamydiaceae bacterium]|jgi:methionyl aminopeptidase
MKESYKKDFIRAGAIAKEVRAFGKELIKKGASYNDVVAKVNWKIRELGARAAFPPQIALNDTAAHFLPQPDKDIIFNNDVVKLDIGVCYNGAIGDCALTVDLSGKYQKLIEAAESALLKAEQSLHVGQPLSDIGGIIGTTIVSYGFQPIKNLAGHGLGYYKIHMPPSIPNYKDKSKGELTTGMTFAIEPFATTGKGLIYEEGEPAIFCFLASRPVRSQICLALIEKIKTFQGLPFAIQDVLSDKYSLVDVQKGLAELTAAGAITSYAPLVEEAHGIVAQAENSVLIDDDGQIFITTR